MELKCIRCGGEAQYIFLAMGSGGSLCGRCFKEFSESSVARARVFLDRVAEVVK
jgi:hypothetical protein